MGRFRLFISELRRRRVFRALVGWGLFSFAVLQIYEPVMHGLHLPEWTLSVAVLALAAGFPATVVLAWVFDIKASGIEATPPVGEEGQGPPSSSPRLRRARLALLLVGLSAVAAAPGLVYFFVWPGGLRRGAGDRGASAIAAPGPSIAVLPFVDMSAQKDQEYFSDGITEEILNALAQVRGLRVVGRTSSFAFKGKNEDLSTIAQKLHVGAVLEGSVRKEGSRLRITAQLINAADGFHTWSRTFDRELAGVFAVQEEIATAVASALQLELLTSPGSKDLRATNPQAYAEYLLGRQLFYRSNLEDYRRAMQAYQRAVDLDPSYAPAWAGLASATYWVADSAESVAAVFAGQERARAAADKAVALRPDLADGYLARGLIRAIVQWDWAGAGEDLRRALALAPESPDVLFSYASVVLRPTGRLEEAAATLRKAIELDPLNARFWNALGMSLVSLGRFGPAREALERSLEINPEQTFAPASLSEILLLEGRPAEALVMARRSSAEMFRLLCAATAHHTLGHSKESQQALDELIAKYAHSAAYQIASAYAWRGEKDRAFEWLERARAQRDGGLGTLKVEPLMRGLRDDPRWRPLLASVHLPLD
jgi:TolB-like protein/Flp pilus assembly protein TadD